MTEATPYFGGGVRSASGELGCGLKVIQNSGGRGERAQGGICLQRYKEADGLRADEMRKSHG